MQFEHRAESISRFESLDAVLNLIPAVAASSNNLGASGEFNEAFEVNRSLARAMEASSFGMLRTKLWTWSSVSTLKSSNES